MAETPEELSKRLEIPLEGLREKLDTMHIKGQINVIHTRSGKKYGLMPLPHYAYILTSFKLHEIHAKRLYCYLLQLVNCFKYYVNHMKTTCSLHRVSPLFPVWGAGIRRSSRHNRLCLQSDALVIHLRSEALSSNLREIDFKLFVEIDLTKRSKL